jgi:hypothetical protein
VWRAIHEVIDPARLKSCGKPDVVWVGNWMSRPVVSSETPQTARHLLGLSPNSVAAQQTSRRVVEVTRWEGLMTAEESHVVVSEVNRPHWFVDLQAQLYFSVDLLTHVINN